MRAELKNGWVSEALPVLRNGEYFVAVAQCSSLEWGTLQQYVCKVGIDYIASCCPPSHQTLCITYLYLAARSSSFSSSPSPPIEKPCPK